eukprot:2967426-Amphidinium_carterae.2
MNPFDGDGIEGEEFEEAAKEAVHKARRVPEEPTATEVQRHAFLNEPYRSQCRDPRECISPRGLADKHKASKEREAGEEEVSLPMLAGKHSKQGWHCASLLP